MRNKDLLHRISEKENYNKLLNSGMFWEIHPELSGVYEEDIILINKNI